MMAIAGVLGAFAATPPACTSLVVRPDVVIGTGAPSGTYYPLGGSICRLFNLDLPHRPWRCSAEPSVGSVANIESLHDGRIDIGIVESDVLADAVAGQGPFASRGPDAGLRVLFTGHVEAFTVVARRALGIGTATELRGMRISIGSPGSGERVSMKRVLAALGFTQADFAEVRELTIAEQHRAFCANELDAIIFIVAHPSGLIEDLVRTCRGVLVDLRHPRVDGVLSEHAEYERVVIPGRTYASNPADVQTIGVRAEIVAVKRLSDALAYEITQHVFDNIDDFRRLHPAFATLSVADMVADAGRVPVHPGAARYYQERGWLP